MSERAHTRFDAFMREMVGTNGTVNTANTQSKVPYATRDALKATAHVTQCDDSDE